MSFVPQPQRQNANSQNAVTPSGSTAPAEVNEAELIFNIRTFDLYFIDRSALMYKDGIAKVRQFFNYSAFVSKAMLTLVTNWLLTSYLSAIFIDF